VSEAKDEEPTEQLDKSPKIWYNSNRFIHKPNPKQPKSIMIVKAIGTNERIEAQ
jgi:hypothetical protein